MILDDDACYRALTTHDARFDGLFFVGVSSTKIYCRTICPAKTPKRENCTFYATAARAESAGYRPCLRCRPELAPGNASVDSVNRIALEAAQLIESGLTDGLSITDIATQIGVSDRHLRRAFEAEYGVSPIAMAQTRQLLAAKQLLTDTRLSVTEVAFASGFSSLRRFNALFKERYRLNPTEIRRARGKLKTESDTLICDAGFRPPFDWHAMLHFLNGRAIIGVESIEPNRYLRTVQSGKLTGWLTAEPCVGKNALRITLSASLAKGFLPIIARVKYLFDLAASPLDIAAQLGAIASDCPGLRIPGSFDGFEMAVRAILGQQITVRAATTITCRFAAAFGTPIETPFSALNVLFPTPRRVAELSIDDIAQLGIISSRAKAIIALAQAVAEGGLILAPGGDVEKTIEKLTTLPGIGIWTAQYIAMRALGWPDAFPHTDIAIARALDERDPKKICAIAENWRPWRGYATMHLWKSLEQSK